MSRTTWFVVSLLVVASMLLAACQPQVQTIEVTKIVAGTPVNVVVTATPAPTVPPPPPAAKPAGPKVLHLDLGPGDVPTIDPALATDMNSIQLVEEMTIGLVRQNDATAQIEKGMATSWTSTDGLTYTFKLRTDVPWVKYDAKTKKVVKVQDENGKDRLVTAKDFEYGILRTLDPKTASDYAYVLTYVIYNGDKFNSSEITSTAQVGVKAIDDSTLQIRFVDQGVYNLNIVGMWVGHAQPSWLIEEKKDRWTETGNQQSYGPFTLKEWIHDSSITLVKNPFWPGMDSVPVAKIDEINFVMLDAAPGFAEFEAGNVDVESIPLDDMDRVRADPKLSKWVANTPTLGTEFLSFNTQKAPLDDIRVRLALAYAIDRKSLVNNINKGQGEPAQWFARPGLTGAPTMDKYPNLGIKYDPAKAKSELDAYLKDKGITADKLDLTLLYNTSESNKKRSEAVVAMWKEVLGINVKLVNQETKVFYKTRKNDPNVQIMRSSWVQDYPDANNFDKEVFAKDGAYSDIVRWNDPKFDDLCAQAAKEQDPIKRIDLYAQAEQYLVSDKAVITPLYWYSSVTIFQPYVKYTPSATGYNWYEKWDIVK